jgi:sugar transferase (PEP-CTERM/EpsH1 system associated)
MSSAPASARHVRETADAQRKPRVPSPPLVVHIIQHLIMGGLENGIVNLINRMPSERYRHAIVCLSHFSEFRDRIRIPGVAVIEIGKRAGKDLPSYLRLWRVLRELKPSIVHTRNVATLDAIIVAWAAGNRHRIHGEHGWDMGDLHGQNRKYRAYRRLCRPFVSRYVAVSRHIAEWLRASLGVPAARIRHICNGVDVVRFHPAAAGDRPTAQFGDGDYVVFGTVGRMQPVKDQATFVHGFLSLIKRRPELRERVRLMLIGDGPCRSELLNGVAAAGASELVWAPGACDDVPALMRAMDVFVLPSLNEGISNTILEAMASGLPVIASNVGGNAELVSAGETGALVAAQDVTAMTAAMELYIDDVARRRLHGAAGRRRAVELFSLEVMVERYLELYDEVLGARRHFDRASTA